MSAQMTLSEPCVVFALRREAMFFRRVYPYRRRFPGAPCRAQFRGTASQKLLMLETGVGEAAMKAALRWCLRGPRFGDMVYRPRLLVSVGFSGALLPGQRVGDLVLATEIVDQRGNQWPALHSDLLINPEIALGRVLTVPELVADPHEKARLGRQHEALAVDMESAAAARLCRQFNVPFACLRVISDDQSTALSPHLVELLRRGRVSGPRLARTVVRHPQLIRQLWHLAGNTRRAAQRLLAVRSLLNAECGVPNAE